MPIPFLVLCLALPAGSSGTAAHHPTCDTNAEDAPLSHRAGTHFAMLQRAADLSHSREEVEQLLEQEATVRRYMRSEEEPQKHVASDRIATNASASSLGREVGDGTGPIPSSRAASLLRSNANESLLTKARDANSPIPQTLPDSSDMAFTKTSFVIKKASTNGSDVAEVLSRAQPSTKGSDVAEVLSRAQASTNGSDVAEVLSRAQASTSGSDVAEVLSHAQASTSGSDVAEVLTGYPVPGTILAKRDRNSRTLASTNGSGVAEVLSHAPLSQTSTEEADNERRKKNMMVFATLTALPLLCLLMGGFTFHKHEADLVGDDSDDYWGAQKNVGM